MSKFLLSRLGYLSGHVRIAGKRRFGVACRGGSAAEAAQPKEGMVAAPRNSGDALSKGPPPADDGKLRVIAFGAHEVYIFPLPEETRVASHDRFDVQTQVDPPNSCIDMAQGWFILGLRWADEFVWKDSGNGQD